MSFAKYAALVKNLRGVVLADLDEPGVWDSVKWLVKRFRYRDLGVTPSMVNRFKDKLNQYLSGNPFVSLTPPIDAVNRFIELLTKVAQLKVEVAELLVYASTYISPAMVIGNSYANDFAKLAVDVVYVCKDMDINSWKLHLRIADYTMLDFYRGCVDEMLEILRYSNRYMGLKSLEEVVARRRERISRDKKRYWRIACEKGRPFLLYVDMGEIVYKYNLLNLMEVDQAACLAIVPLILLPPNLR